jgi:hypothetical protein
MMAGRTKSCTTNHRPPADCDDYPKATRTPPAIASREIAANNLTLTRFKRPGVGSEDEGDGVGSGARVGSGPGELGRGVADVCLPVVEVDDRVLVSRRVRLVVVVHARLQPVDSRVRVDGAPPDPRHLR